MSVSATAGAVDGAGDVLAAVADEDADAAHASPPASDGAAAAFGSLGLGALGGTGGGLGVRLGLQALLLFHAPGGADDELLDERLRSPRSAG